MVGPCRLAEHLRGDSGGAVGTGLRGTTDAAGPERVHTRDVVTTANRRHGDVSFLKGARLGRSGAFLTLEFPTRLVVKHGCPAATVWPSTFQRDKGSQPTLS